MSDALITSLWQLGSLLLVGGVGMWLGRRSCPHCTDLVERLAEVQEDFQRQLSLSMPPRVDADR